MTQAGCWAGANQPVQSLTLGHEEAGSGFGGKGRQGAEWLDVVDLGEEGSTKQPAGHEASSSVELPWPLCGALQGLQNMKPRAVAPICTPPGKALSIFSP